MAFDGKHSDITGKIISAYFSVYNNLGYGFNEKVYENAMAVELKGFRLDVQQQAPIQVFYKDRVIGEYYADFLVNQLVLVELKAVKQLLDEHEAQLLNYLKATNIEVGLLINFGPKAQHLRKVYDNERKGSLAWIRDN
jgi:GxxExxY protein